MKKRTLLMAIALVASLALVTTGTLAYLTDTDSDVNVMTIGNVDIEQHEMKRVDGVDYNATLKEGDLEPFEDGIKLFPAYPTTAEPEKAYDAMQNKEDGIKWGPYVHDSNAWNGLWSDDNLVGAVDKMVFVENTGSSDAYVRTLLAFEKPEGVMIGWGSEHADIVLNMNGYDLYGNSAGKASTVPMCEIEIDGITYEVYEFCYDRAMKPGEWTRPSLLQVVMTNWADNETVALLGDTYEVLALSQAVQVENLEQLGAQGALDAAFGKVNIENATKWFSEMEGMPVTTASTAEELTAALANGGTVVVTGDIELADEQITLTEDTNLVLSGNITADPGTLSSTYGMFNIPSGVTLTVGGEGSIVLDTETSKGISAVIFQNDGDLIINSGNYLAVCNNSASASIVAVVDNVPNSTDSSVTINSGTLAVAGTRAPNIIRCWPLASGADTYLTINGGTFKANPDRTSTYIWSKNDTRWDKDPVSHSYVTINGGTFEDILLEVDGFVADHDIDSSVTGITMVEGTFNGYVDASGNKI